MLEAYGSVPLFAELITPVSPTATGDPAVRAACVDDGAIDCCSANGLVFCVGEFIG